jgi:hypothetical protein
MRGFAFYVAVIALLMSACRSRKHSDGSLNESDRRDAGLALDADVLDADGWRHIRWDMNVADLGDALRRDGIAYSVERIEKDPVGPHGEVMHVIEEHVRFAWDGASADAWLNNARLISIDFEWRGLSAVDAEQRFIQTERRFGAPVAVQRHELGVWLHGGSTISVTVLPYPNGQTYTESWTPYGAPR